MNKKIFLSVFLTSALVLLLSFFVSLLILTKESEKITKNELKEEINILKENVDSIDKTPLSSTRITLINKDGVVLFDSVRDSSSLDNHKDREEVKEALSSGFGESFRYSDTLLEKRIYIATSLDNGNVLRLSKDANSIFLLLRNVSPYLVFLFLVLLIFSVLISKITSKRIVKPLLSVDLDNPEENVVYDELTPFLKKIKDQINEIKRKEKLYLEKKNEAENIVNNIKEGIIVINKNGKITSFNNESASLFEKENLYGMDVYTLIRDVSFLNFLDGSLNGIDGKVIVSLSEKKYEVISSIVEDSVIFLFRDVDEREKREEERREFTANVSHELKTPLHSIMGYSELLKNNLVDKDDIPSFYEKIYTLSKEMSSLISDIIKLSHLDEGFINTDENINIKEIINNILKTFQDNIKKKNISVNIFDDDLILKGNKTLYFDIFYNLIDNAIKYNKKDGFINISLKREEGKVFLTIEDGGIGIDIVDEERIFERFYRGDKSHNKEIDGTGLGLSIVKHSVENLNGEIKVESVKEKGTKFTLIFPFS